MDNQNDDKHSEFLRFDRKVDRFIAQSSDLTAPGISFLRLEFGRVRVGMGDYLLKVATPKSALGGKSNTVVTLRASKKHGSSSGMLATAKLIIAEMLKRGDTTTDWDRVDPNHLARLIAPPLKFFSANTNSDRLQYVTEAIA